MHTEATIAENAPPQSSTAMTEKHILDPTHPNHNYQKIRERARKIRLTRGISQAELAKKLNVKQETISQIELGKIAPSIEIINGYISNFSIDYEELIMGRGAMFRPQTSIPITPSMVSTTLTSNDCKQTHIQNQHLNEDIKFHKKTIENLQSVVTNLQASNASLQVQNERYQTKIDILQQKIKIEALERLLMIGVLDVYFGVLNVSD